MLFDGEKVGIVTAPMDVKPINLYPKEQVEHLVDQLIKLQNTYNDTYMKSHYIDKSKLSDAMTEINKAIRGALTTKLEFWK